MVGSTIIGMGGGSSASGDVQALITALLNGSIIPALAKNLYTDTDKNQTNQSFLLRTTANTDSIRSGAAILKKLYGVESRTQAKVSEVLADETTNTFVNFGLVTVDLEHETQRSMHGYPIDCTYDGSVWKEGGSPINLETYGISVEYTAPINGDGFKIVNDLGTIEYTNAARFSTSFNKSAFRTKADESVVKGNTHTFTFEYVIDGTWSLNGVEVTLADYGLTMTPVEGVDIFAGSTISITYTRASNGKLEFASPTALKALGLNSCNCFDPNRMVLANKTIDASGAIVDAQGSYVAYARAVYNASNTNGYAVYDTNGSVTKVGWVATLPTASTTGITLGTPNAQLSHVTFAANGYIVVSCTDVSGLCIHPSWSGREDKTYAAYSESVFAIPTKDASNADIVGAGWAVGTHKNIFDFSAKTYTQNVTRIAYTAEALAQLFEDNPTWVENTDYAYDNDYIYHKQTAVVKNLPATADGIYYCNDYSVEEFVGTSVAPLADFVYGQNIMDKILSDMLTRNQVVAMKVILDDNTELNYNILQNPL